MISKDELKQLFVDTESYHVERTVSIDDADKFCMAICAFSNDVSGSGKNGYLISKYPYWATRELLMNAVMHRDYETNAPVQFYEYDDRIEVQNPGGLYGKVSPDNFPNVSDYRYPYIAEAIKVLGYVNRFSRGVFRVQKELKENGNGEASFDFSLFTAFKVIEKVSEKYFELGFGIDENPEKAQEKPKKSPRSTQILAIIRTNPQATRNELAKLLNCTQYSIKYHLRQLTNASVLKHKGPTKAGKWIILEGEAGT